MMKGRKKTGPNISVSHVIKSFILSLPPVFSRYVGDFFFFNYYYCSELVPQQEHDRSSALQNLTSNRNS